MDLSLSVQVGALALSTGDVFHQSDSLLCWLPLHYCAQLTVAFYCVVASRQMFLLLLLHTDAFFMFHRTIAVALIVVFWSSVWRDHA